MIRSPLLKVLRLCRFFLLSGGASLVMAAPPVLTLLNNLSAGTIVAGTTGGTLSIGVGSTTLSVSGGVTLHGTTTGTRGRFNFSGTRNNAYALAFASANPVTLTGSNGGTMSATVTESAALTGTFPTTTVNCYLGANIIVGDSNSTPAGTYTGNITMRVTDTTVVPNQATPLQVSLTVIVDPGITLTKVSDLSFGDLFPSGTLGTVVLTAAGARSRTGGVTLLTLGSSQVSPARFTVGGKPSATYTITVPASITLTNTSTGTTMLVNTITRTPTGNGTLSAAGAQTLAIGGTLRVAANQADGNYSGTFNVTVTYN